MIILVHSMAAALMFALVYIITKDSVAAAAFPISFYYSREVNQFQTDLAKERKVFRSSLWYRGWWLGEWGTWQKRLEFLAPAAVSLILAKGII